MYRLLVLVLLATFACHKDTTATEAACAKAKPEGPLGWIEDDYPAAIACAKGRHLPIVVDLWAPWCHTCLSMRSTVFTDPSFKPDATRFVFVSLDTDREANAPILEKFPLSAWPTFYVISPEGMVLARFVGAASLAQFHAFLDAGVRAMTTPTVGADAHLLAAERATAAQDLNTTERELDAALQAAPADWPRRPDALVSLIHLMRKREDLASCLQIAEASMDDTGSAASATDFLSIALECATADAKAEPARVAKLRERSVNRLQKLLDDPKSSLSIDDRSDAMKLLRGVFEELGRTPEANVVAEKQRTMLDDAVAAAPTAKAAMIYNDQRSEVYAYLGRPLDVAPALEKSATDFPTEYDPRARLGRILLEGGKLDEAAKWTDAALSLVYGPRKARVLALRAEIAAKQGDKATEKRCRQEIVKVWESAPPGHANAKALQAAKSALADLD